MTVCGACQRKHHHACTEPLLCACALAGHTGGGGNGKHKDDDGSIEARFLKFHANNPQVYTTLVRFTRAAQARGKRRIGIGMVWEVMRWELWLEITTDDTDYRLNNDYRSRFARLIMAQEPDLLGIFEIRRLRAK